METAAPKRKLAAIVFTDLKDFSKKTRADESATLRLLEKYNSLINADLQAYEGNVVKTVGDAFLVDFSSAVNAVQYAIRLQAASREYNRDKTENDKIQLRIGIHIGDVVVLENDIMGDAVNIASRIQPFAEPGGICITRDVYHQVQGKIHLRGISIGTPDLKNIQDRVEVYRIATGETGRSSWLFLTSWCRAKAPVFRRFANIFIAIIVLAAGKIIADTVIRVNRLTLAASEAAKTNTRMTYVTNSGQGNTNEIVANPQGTEGDYNVVIVQQIRNGKIVSTEKKLIPAKN